MQMKSQTSMTGVLLAQTLIDSIRRLCYNTFLFNTETNMKIQFDKDTMPDELYNALLQHFVNEAVGLGVEVNKFTQFNNWVVECDVDVKEAVH